jgi:hypothetical protein
VWWSGDTAPHNLINCIAFNRWISSPLRSGASGTHGQEAEWAPRLCAEEKTFPFLSEIESLPLGVPACNTAAIPSELPRKMKYVSGQRNHEHGRRDSSQPSTLPTLPACHSESNLSSSESSRRRNMPSSSMQKDHMEIVDIPGRKRVKLSL